MLRKMIWRKTERCEGLVRYYSDTAKMYYFLSLVFKAIIILYSSSNVLGWIDSLEESTMIHLIIVLFLVLESILGVEKKYALCSTIRGRVDKVRTKFHHLWMEYESKKGNDKEILMDKFNILDNELDESTGLADTYRLMEVKYINKRSANQAKEAMKGRYEQENRKAAAASSAEGITTA